MPTLPPPRCHATNAVLCRNLWPVSERWVRNRHFYRSEWRRRLFSATNQILGEISAAAAKKGPDAFAAVTSEHRAFTPADAVAKLRDSGVGRAARLIGLAPEAMVGWGSGVGGGGRGGKGRGRRDLVQRRYPSTAPPTRNCTVPR